MAGFLPFYPLQWQYSTAMAMAIAMRKADCIRVHKLLDQQWQWLQMAAKECC